MSEENRETTGASSGLPADRGQGEGTIRIEAPALIVQWPDGRQEKVVLQPKTTRVGRQLDTNDIKLPVGFESISRAHFELTIQGVTCTLTDLGSTNGVLLNGERIVEPVQLSEGDVIAVGDEDQGERITLTYQMGSLALLAGLAVEPEAKAPAKLEQAEIMGATLRAQLPGSEELVVTLDRELTLIGRSAQAHLRLPERLRFISDRHAEIQRSGTQYVITDLGSTNGTRLNGNRLPANQATPLRDGSILRLGDEALGISIGITFSNPEERAASIEGFFPTALDPTMRLIGETTVIGRALECDLVLSSPRVSRRHAVIEPIPGGYALRDLKSLNGTYVNDQRVDFVELQEGDWIQIEDHILLFSDGQVTRFDSQGMRVDVTGLVQEITSRGHTRRILDDVTFTILPREFVAIVGASGSGKSTLMNALIGTWPAQGEVRLNGYDLYEEYQKFRGEFGYVPQDDILHATLSVDRALSYAARLRLPAGTTSEERAERITKALETVGLNNEAIRRTRIGRLSGGQRKRVSIAAELLADPKLFFLDEATSGLDPGLEKKLMFTLRRMADEGRTVVLITHATANIVQVDHVIFLASGKLVFFGTPAESLPFFEVDEFADIYEHIEGRGDEWRDTYLRGKPDLANQYIHERQSTRLIRPLQEAQRRFRGGVREFLNQLGVLVLRTMNVLTSDITTLVLLLLLFPLTATLQLVISSPDILTGNLAIMADPARAASELATSYIPFTDLNTFIFVMGLEAVLVGMYVPSNELIKERTIYIRERMVNLKLLPYLLSKVIVFTLFAAIQCVLYLLVLSLGVDFPEQGVYLPFVFEVWITLFLTMLASNGIGLVVSAISSSSDMAIYVLVILLFYQFFFAGTVFDLRDNPAESLSYTTTTRWSLLALGSTIDIVGQAESTILCSRMPDDPRTPSIEDATICRPYPEAREDLMLPYGDSAVLESWGVLAATILITVTVTGFLIKRQDRV